MIKKMRLPLRRIVRGIIKMVKNLTFWSVIWGFILGVFTNSTEDMPLSAWDTHDARFWRFYILLIIVIVSGVVFYFIEKKQGNETQILNDNIKQLINEIRQDRNERKQSNTDKPSTD